MTRTPEFFTATMAKLYADQGYLRKAAAIYSYLVDQNPDRQDLGDALAAVETQIKLQDKPNWKELGLLLREWIALQREYNGRNLHYEKENS